MCDLFLQWITAGIGAAVDVNLRDLEFHCLAFGRGLDQHAGGGNAAAGGDLFQDIIGYHTAVDHCLDASEARAVIDFDECDPFGVTPGTNPTPQCNGGPYRQTESLLDADRLLIHTRQYRSLSSNVNGRRWKIQQVDQFAGYP